MPWTFTFDSLEDLLKARTAGAAHSHLADESTGEEPVVRRVLWLVRDGKIQAEQVSKNGGKWGYLPVEHRWSTSCPATFLELADEPADSAWRDRVRRRAN